MYKTLLVCKHCATFANGKCWLLPLKTDVDGCREDEIADLDFGVYHGHDSHGSRSIIMITGFLMASLSSSSEFEEQLLISF